MGYRKIERYQMPNIFVSHGHDDHYGDIDFIAKANDARYLYRRDRVAAPLVVVHMLCI